MGQGKRLPVPEDGSGGSQELEKPLAGGSVPCRLGAQQPAQPQSPTTGGAWVSGVGTGELSSGSGQLPTMWSWLNCCHLAYLLLSFLNWTRSEVFKFFLWK